MTSERPFQIALCALFTCYTIIRVYFRRRVEGAHNPRALPSRTLDTCVLRVLIPYEVLTLFTYIVAQAWLAWASLPLWVWARWSGVVPGVAALALFVWAHLCLGSNYSKWLVVHSEHTLVTHGPYRWVRHPMYTAFYLLHAAVLLLSANWFLGLTWIVGLTLVIVARVRREEAILVARFGDDYVEYAARTNRFLPCTSGSTFHTRQHLPLSGTDHE
jgi:protein-S-isoprenylcysteine O-methyltransferase Ste14